MNKSYDRPGKTSTVRAFMREHAGESYTPAEVAQATGLSTHEAAMALSYLSERMEILRWKHPKQRTGPGSVKYKGLAVIAQPDEEATA